MEPQENNQQEVRTEPQIKKTPSINIPTAIITAGVVIALALILSGKTPEKEVKNQAPTTSAPAEKIALRAEDYVRGDLTKAQVVIVEYSDSDCPFCQRFHTTMKDILSSYGTKVAWVYRYFPLSIHADAQNEAIALECAAQVGGNDVFWKYLDQVIDITVSADKSASVLTGTATALGIDGSVFTKCLSNPSIVKKIDAQSEEAKSLGAQGTPYSIALTKTGEQVAIPGAYPIEEMKKIIDGLLK